MRINRVILLILILSSGAACLFLWRVPMPYRDFLAGAAGLQALLPDGGDTAAGGRRRFPGEAGRVLRGTAEDYRELAAAYPDRPWYLWQWVRMTTEKPERFHPSYHRPAAPENVRRMTEAFRDFYAGLAEKDPGNGYPLLMMALAESLYETSTVSLDAQWKFPDRDSADRAMDLIRQAAAAGRVTVYSQEMLTEWQTILGRPLNFAEEVRREKQMAKAPFFIFFFDDHLIRCLAAEWEGRLREPLRDGAGGTAAAAKAAAVFHDLQTIGALCIFEAGASTDVYQAVHYIENASLIGGRMLEAAGYREKAEELASRGRRLIRPYLLARYMLAAESRYGLQGLYGLADTEVAEEANQLYAVRRKKTPRPPEAAFPPDVPLGLSSSAYDLQGLWNRYVPWTSPRISPAAASVMARYQDWARQKSFLVFVTAVCWLLLLFSAGLYSLHALLYRGGDSPLPSARRCALAAAVCGAAAAVPGVAAGFAGNLLWSNGADFLRWQMFWAVWGPLFGGWLLLVRLRRDSRTAAAAEGPDTGTAAGGWQVKTAAAGLAAAAGCAGYGYFLLHEQRQLYGSLFETAPPAWLAAAACLGLVCLVFAAALLRWLRILISRRPEGAAKTPALRYLLAGWAGGLLLLAASYLIMDSEENWWFRQDALLYADGDAIRGSSKIESEITDLYAEHVREILEEEKHPAFSADV